MSTVPPPAADAVLHAPEELRTMLGIPFTDEQLAAATSPAEPSVVIAGAGSGKTSVMAARVVWLVGTGQVRADQVLGLTFTNRAASELASRVRDALNRLPSPDSPYPESQIDAEPVIATYHSYAGRLLREHGLRLGLEPDARLLTEATRFQLAQAVVRRAPGPLRHLEATVTTITTHVVRLDAELDEHLVDVADLIADAEQRTAVWNALEKVMAPVRDARVVAEQRLELLELVAAFRAEKRARDVVDFGDQIAWSARLAQQFPAVGMAERERFRAVLLDEYQDTSVAQMRLLAALFGGGHLVTAVGDPFQAIYGWRGASVRNIGGFPRHFPRVNGQPAQLFPLGQNNRSDVQILATANQLAAPLRERHPEVAPLRPRRDAARGDVSAAMYATYPDEVQAVAADIAARVESGERPGSIAVLVRRREEFAPYYAALVALGVPIEVVGLGGLLELPEVVDVVSMLEVLDDATANPALVRLLAGPRWRIGPRDLALLGRQADRLVRAGHLDDAAPAGAEVADAPDLAEQLREAVAGVDPAEVVSLSEAMEHPGPWPYSAEARERFARFAAELRLLRRHAGEPLADLVTRIVDTLGLDVEIAASPAGRSARRSAALASFVEHAAAFVDLDASSSIAAFLAYLRAATDVEGGLDASAPTPADSVKLLTVHKAKGLEWDVVYLPALVDDVFPSSRGRPSWLRRPEVLPPSLRGDAADFPAEPTWTTKGLTAYHEELKEIAATEERRLGYVALTRARHALVLTGHRWGAPQKPRQPSDFLLAAVEALGLPTDGDHWAPAPADGEVNPLRAVEQSHSWPVPLEPRALQRRRDAAEQVRRAVQRWAGELPGQEWELTDVVGTGFRPPMTAGPADLSTADAVTAAEWDDELALLLREAATLLTPQHTVPLPASLSASQLVQLAADASAFARELARPMPRPPAPAATRGTRFHAWVESRFGQTALIDLDDLASTDAVASSDDDLSALQAAFLAGPFAERVPLQVEAPFAVALGRHIVRGRIDAVYEEVASDGTTRYEVVDWKTGRAPADPLQLAVYREAWAQLRGVPSSDVGAAFYYVTSGDVVRPPDLPGAAQLIALLDAAAAPAADDS
jgi:DNA helicase-2/ATP-dependent DNA helicase PcrA